MSSPIHYNKINEPIRVNLFFFSINFMELAAVSLSFFLIMIGFGVFNMFVAMVGLLPFGVICILYVPVLYIMSYANRHDHPQFIVSIVAFRLFQPRNIQVYNPQFKR